MPDYGDVEYWNSRYNMELTESFDWLFDYKHVSNFISQVVDVSNDVLIVGSGNALFSKDMYDAGYTKLTNIDLSSVVIDQMKAKFPEMEWKTMDALDMTFESGSWASIVDKSLIDTFLCYQNSIPCTKQFLRETYRVLKPGGIMVTFSLHGMDEVLPFFKQDGMDWKVHAFRVANPRWDAEEQCRRSVAHTMVITQKAPATMPDTLELEGVLSNEDYEQLLKSASEIVDKALFTKASVVDLISCLDFALHQYASTLSSLGTEKKIVDTAE